MQLTRFTDLGLRVLMYLSGAVPETVTTIAEITQRFDVPHNHLAKVVQFMGQQGWLHTVRGKGGGVSLALPLKDYPLGYVVRTLERSEALIDCTQPPCVLRGRCSLKGLLDDAQEAFYDHLDQFTLADAVKGATDRALVRLHRARPAVPAA